MDPTKIRVVDISQTRICPMAQYVRKRLRYMNIFKGFKAVYSFELPARHSIMVTDGSRYKKSAYGTISYLPATFGLTCASVVIRDIVGWKDRKGQKGQRGRALTSIYAGMVDGKLLMAGTKLTFELGVES